MKILKQQCTSADIVIEEMHLITVEIKKGAKVTLSVSVIGEIIDTLVPYKDSDRSKWYSISPMQRIKVTALIEKTLNKTL